MSLFGGGSSFGNTSVFGQNTSTNHNPMKDIEVTSPPDDSVSSIAFSPGVLPSTFLVASSWDNNVRFLSAEIRTGHSTQLHYRCP